MTSGRPVRRSIGHARAGELNDWSSAPARDQCLYRGLMGHLVGSVEHDRSREREPDEAVFGPFDFGWNENAAFEADMDLCSWNEVAGIVAHCTAFGKIVQCKAAWRSIDQQLELAPRCRLAWMAALICRTEFARSRGRGHVLQGGLSKWDRRAAKTAFGAYSADIPMRSAATGAMIGGVGAVDNMVPALGEACSK